MNFKWYITFRTFWTIRKSHILIVIKPVFSSILLKYLNNIQSKIYIFCKYLFSNFYYNISILHLYIFVVLYDLIFQSYFINSIYFLAYPRVHLFLFLFFLFLSSILKNKIKNWYQNIDEIYSKYYKNRYY